MTVHLIEAGPGSIRQLCCGTARVADLETARAALDGIDDPVALVGGGPVGVESLWRDVMRSLRCADRGRVVVVHPSWWAPTRVERLRAAAGEAQLRPRSWLLARAVPRGSPHPAVVVEIAERIVVVTGAAVVAEPRLGEPRDVAATVAGVIAEPDGPVVIDAPAAVDEADTLATLIAEALSARSGRCVVRVDDAGVRRLAAAALSQDQADDRPPAPDAARGGRRWMVAAALVLITAVAGSSVLSRGHPSAGGGTATTFLVEGVVALEVPAQWPVQRVTAGPGSARVQVTSPVDPQVALHVTQSRVAGETLTGTAETLKHAIDAEPAGVFVDFDPSAHSAGRPAVTYREIRPAHDIRWSVLLDRAVRISIGCQSPPGRHDAVDEVCERAVRSARAIR